MDLQDVIDWKKALMYDRTMIKKELIMIKKKILKSDRVRRIDGGFSFIPHRFLADGFLTSLSQKEILLYLFLILVSDRHGLSFYSYDSICSLLQITADEYIDANDQTTVAQLIQLSLKEAHNGS